LSDNGMTRTITITSGKGGVGKTSISVNVALHLASLGYRTCLFDADLGLANINILLGLSPEYNLEDVIFNRHSLQDIIIRNYKGIDIIPGSSGVEEMANLESDQVDHLIQSFSELDGYDFLLFDTSAGVSRNVLAFCLASSEVAMIVTPEPTSLTDAYALLKILTLNGFSSKVKIVVNQCKSIPIAKLTYNKFKATVQRYLHTDVMPLGVVIQDQKVVEAIKTQQALILLYPESNASKGIRRITKNLLEHRQEDLETSDMVSFWTKWLRLIKSPLNLAGPEKAKKGIESQSATEHPLKKAPQLAQGTKQKNVPAESEDNGVTVQSLERPAQEESIQPQTPQEQDATVKTPGPSKPADIAHAQQDISLVMSKLIDSVSSVSQELQLIRKAMEERGQNALGMKGLVDEGQKAIEHKSITLDFDDFLKQRATDVGKEDNG
jgi:MinD-like ATPase involved in chromosome partitioning or flagellar assembly